MKAIIMKISYSFGMVDLLHYGHVNSMKMASKDADLNIFGLVSDDATYAMYGSHVSDYNERKSVLESISYIDEVMEQATFDPVENLRLIHAKYPDSIITLYYGKEWGVLSAQRYLESIGGKTVRLDYYDKLSPEKILSTLNRNAEQTRTTSNLISTKASTLAALKDTVSRSTIEELIIITIGELNQSAEKCADRVQREFKGRKVVVRSSSKREDAYEESNAGHFTSVLGVKSDSHKDVIDALCKVKESYGQDIEEDEQILVQTQTEGVLVSGVVFTRDIQRNRPYYVINYDDSGSTDSVTSGSAGKSIWISYSADRESIPAKWKKLMDAVWELEEILPGILLDVEFAVTEGKVVIFQVRPLAAAYKFGRKNDSKVIEEAKDEAGRKYNKVAELGLTCFSDMAFWNPAEIIGDNPKNLDFSLYREIITKSAWDEGLIPMGYRTVTGELMYRFGNKPYISIEKSFEALMPSILSDELASKLREYYRNKLMGDFSAHDKIEFEISHNCFDFSMHKRLALLMADGFKTEEILEIEKALRNLTKKNIREYPETLRKDREDLKELEGIRLDVHNISKDTANYQILARCIRTLLDGIDKFGTPQFARQARCAFIAKSISRSLVVENYITTSSYNQFMSGINTIAVEYDRDYHRVLKGQMSHEEFALIYGHLRAGTYNVRSPRYDQMDQLFPENETSEEVVYNSNETADEIVKIALKKAMEEADINELNSDEVVSFIKQSTEQREYFKFVFTKSLSFAIELIKRLGVICDINVRDLSYLELPEIYAAEYYSDVERLHEFWSLIIDKRKEIYKINSEMILPAVISSEKDFCFIENIDARPNYITENKVTGDVVVLEDETEETVDGKVVVIEKADPGYDWIFSKGIVGLITKYGGAASHMAIRCAEFKIPAAIGTGAVLFEYASGSKRITIDCKHEKMLRIEEK